MTDKRALEIVRDALTCECGSRMIPTIKGEWICEKTADKYEATHGQRIKL
jgi:hypothetical protein